MTGAAYGPADFARDLAVSHETRAKFEAWVALLQKWNPRINLVASSTMVEVWRRHILDSAQLVDSIPDRLASPLRIIDLGSGAGFPGLAVALMLPERGRAGRVTLAESNAKKAAFLREAIRATGADAQVRAARIEDMEPQAFDLVTARALAPLTRLLGHAAIFHNENTVGLFLKGQDVELEIAAANESWWFRSDLSPSRSDPNGRIVRIEGLTQCPNRLTGQ